MNVRMSRVNAISSMTDINNFRLLGFHVWKNLLTKPLNFGHCASGLAPTKQTAT